MKPILVDWGHWVIHSYSFLLVLSFFIGLSVAYRQMLRLGFHEPERGIRPLFESFFMALVGARLLFIFTNWPLFQSGRFQWWALWQGGLVFYGGALLGVSWYVWRLGRLALPRELCLNAAAPALALSHAIGRVGCFLNGCCYGHPSDLPWSMVFDHPYSAAQPKGVSLHPVQLYEAFGLAVLAVFLFKINKLGGRWRGRATWWWYLLLYSLGRFFLEFFRGDSLRGSWGPFYTSQWIALGIGLAVVLLDFRRPRVNNSAHEN